MLRFELLIERVFIDIIFIRRILNKRIMFIITICVILILIIIIDVMFRFEVVNEHNELLSFMINTGSGLFDSDDLLFF